MPQIKENDPKYSDKVSARFVDILNKNLLNYSDELKIIEVIFQKYKFETISDYAKSHDKAYNTVKEKVEKGKIMYIKLGGIIFVCD